MKKNNISFSRLRTAAPSAVLKLLMYAVLLDLSFVFLYPFVHMLITSLKSPMDLTDISVKWVLNSLHFDNYRLAFTTLDYVRRFLNTSMITVLTITGHVLSCSFVGYGFARYNFKGKKLFFMFLILSMIVPLQTIIVPIYLFYSKIGWIGTQLPIIIPAFLGYGIKGALFIFIFRQFFLSLPKSLEEAAYIDGCGRVGTFFKIALPASRSSILVCVVLGMVWQWNDSFECSIFIKEQHDFLLTQVLPGLYNIINTLGTSSAAAATEASDLFNEAVVMAATTLTILPLLIVYAFLQKRFMGSVERSGITGE